MNITDILPYFQVVLAACAVVGTIIGSFYALRFGYTKSTEDIQARVIAALKEENETLDTKVEQMSKEVERLKRVLDTVRFALKRRGLQITVNGDFITFYDVQTRVTKTASIRTKEQIEADAAADDNGNGASA